MKEGGKEGQFMHLRSLPGTSQPLPPDLREAFTAALADILIADYQLNQQDIAGTGVEGSLLNRSRKSQKRPHFMREMD
jgi:hypothetical protein